MESVCGESNYVYPLPSRQRYSGESISGESVSESVSDIIASEKTFNQNYPDTPRIRQLKREIIELQAELELSYRIDDLKRKIKKYPRQV